jgi:hypothetical protein
MPPWRVLSVTHWMPPRQSAGISRARQSLRSGPGFDDVPGLSTSHQRFTRVRLPRAHLTGTSRLFRSRLPPQPLCRSSSRWSEPWPCSPSPGGAPNISRTARLLRVGAYISASYRAFVAHSRRPTLQVPRAILSRPSGQLPHTAGRGARNQALHAHRSGHGAPGDSNSGKQHFSSWRCCSSFVARVRTSLAFWVKDKSSRVHSGAREAT